MVKLGAVPVIVTPVPAVRVVITRLPVSVTAPVLVTVANVGFAVVATLCGISITPATTLMFVPTSITPKLVFEASGVLYAILFP
jgi:hypothetical protein